MMLRHAPYRRADVQLRAAAVENRGAPHRDKFAAPIRKDRAPARE